MCVCVCPRAATVGMCESKEGLSGFKWEPEVASHLELGLSAVREKIRQALLSILGSLLRRHWGVGLGLLWALCLRGLPQDPLKRGDSLRLAHLWV